MLQKDQLLIDLDRLFKANIAARTWQKEVATTLYARKNIPIEISTSILTLRTELKDYDDFILFSLAQVCGLNIDYYFTPSEIHNYGAAVMQAKQVTFPYKFEKMVEIKESSQYIGRITVKELIRLRDAQLINYNENAQRTLKQLPEGYTININRKAVNSIMEMLKTGDFVPNTLTFNISPDTDFTYNKETMTLTIKDEIKFDILDGYHRLIALSNMYNLNHKFNYPMELRIVVFPEIKERHFIWQEDQKTKMRKIDSDALSATDPANEICAKIKNKLAGTINIARNGGVIDEAVLSELIRCLCIKSGIRYDNKAKNELSNLFVNAVNLVQDEYDIDLKEKWSVPFTIAFALLAFNSKMNKDKLLSIEKIIKDNNMVIGKTVNRTIVNRIRKAVMV